jgi:peptide/nickel transport system permease protein
LKILHFFKYQVLCLASTLLSVSLITFLLFELVPGDAAEMLLHSQGQFSEEKIVALRINLGLDASLPLRYLFWLQRVLVLDFGNSFRSGEPVSQELLRCLPVTLSLALLSFVFVLVFSFLGGSLAAFYHNRRPDRYHRAWTILILSIPDYWLGLIFILIFSLHLQWIPIITGSSCFSLFVLPVLTLGLAVSAAEGRIFRTSILDVLSQDYVLFASAKGLRPHKVFCYHVFKPALLPMLSIWGMLLGSLLGGSVVVESVFSLPGLGKLAADAVMQRDMPMIQGAVLSMTFFFVIASFIMESVRAALIPFRQER